MTVWICVDTNKQVGDSDHLKVFTSEDAASEWFKDNDRVPRHGCEAATRRAGSNSFPPRQYDVLPCSPSLGTRS